MTRTQPFTIIGAVDKSDQARLVLARIGSEAAASEFAEIHVVRVLDVKPKYADRISSDDERNALLSEVKEVLGAFDAAAKRWRLHVHLRVGRPDEEILALAHEARADVIAIGHHGEGAPARRFAGNTVERVLRLAPCTVMVVQDRLYDVVADEQCQACVTARRNSAGEVWFCESHRGDDRPIHDVMPHIATNLHSVGFGGGGVF